MSPQHDIIWTDDGMIGYRCRLEDHPAALTGTIDCESGESETTCEKCGATLKATWHVLLEEVARTDQRGAP